MSIVHTNARNNMEKLERRLSDGWKLIQERRAAGIDVADLEDFWCQLLRKYEIASDLVNGTKRKGN